VWFALLLRLPLRDRAEPSAILPSTTASLTAPPIVQPAEVCEGCASISTKSGRSFVVDPGGAKIVASYGKRIPFRDRQKGKNISQMPYRRHQTRVRLHSSRGRQDRSVSRRSTDAAHRDVSRRSVIRHASEANHPVLIIYLDCFVAAASPHAPRMTIAVLSPGILLSDPSSKLFRRDREHHAPPKSPTGHPHMCR